MVIFPPSEIRWMLARDCMGRCLPERPGCPPQDLETVSGLLPPVLREAKHTSEAANRQNGLPPRSCKYLRIESPGRPAHPVGIECFGLLPAGLSHAGPPPFSELLPTGPPPRQSAWQSTDRNGLLSHLHW